MQLRVTTGRRVLTTRNESLNILRNTVACYAGAIGGADIITTTPFDAPTGLPSEGARRNARNTHHILAEECHLAQVIDPGGGSWYIEWYTDELAKRAWSVFQQIETQGGMIKAAGRGWVAEQIKPAEAAREKDIAGAQGGDHRRERASESDRAPHRAGAARLPRARYGGGAAPVQLAARAWPFGGARRPGRHRPWRRRAHRGRDRRGGGRRHAGTDRQAVDGERRRADGDGAAPGAPYDDAFEKLRDAADAFEGKRGRRPRVYLAGVGSIAEQVARKNYARDFFQAGGFEVVACKAKSDVAEAGAAFASGERCDLLHRQAVWDHGGGAGPKLKAAGARTWRYGLIRRSVHLFLSGHYGKYRSGGLGDGLEGIGDIPGQQFIYSVDRMFGDASQDLAEISFRVYSVQLCGAHQRVNGGSTLAAGVRAAEKIILAPQSYGTKRPLSRRVIDLQQSIINITCERAPVRKRIADRPRSLTFCG